MINIHTLTAIDITVVLYFFLLLFKFLYASIPPVLNSFAIIFGTFSLLGFIFISAEFLSNSIGFTLLALFADINADRYIVTNPNTIDIIIAHIFAENSIPSIPSNRNSPSNAPTILSRMYIAPKPDIIPYRNTNYS